MGITIGNATTTTTTSLVASTTLNLGAVTPTISLGGSANSTIGIGAIGTAASTTILNLATSTGAAQTVNIGSTYGASITTINGGAGNSALSIQAGAGGSINIGSTNNNNIYFGTAATTGIIQIGGTSETGTATLQTEGISQVLTGSATAPSDVIKTSTNSTTAFTIQNASGYNELSVNTSGNSVNLGNITTTTGAGIAGSLVLADGTTDGFGSTLKTTTLTASQTITLPNASGTVCLTSQNCSTQGSGYIINQSSTPGTPQTGNFNISGTGIAVTLQGSTSVLTPTLDAVTSGGAIKIGSGNAATGSVNIGYAMSTGNVTIGGGGQTGGITIGKSTATNTINIGSGSTASGSTQTIDIGTNGLSGATTDITLGSTASGGSTSIQAEGITSTINGSATAPGEVIQTPTNSVTAFQIQNAAGTSNLFVADTVDNCIGIDTSTCVGMALNASGAIQQSGFSTSNTSNTGTFWTELGSCTITGQYQACLATVSITGGHPSNANMPLATLSARVKQQGALGDTAANSLDIELSLGNHIEYLNSSDFVAVITQYNTSGTVVQLWGDIGQAYDQWSVAPIVNSDTQFVWTPSSGLASSYPAGQTTGLPTNFSSPIANALYGTSYANSGLVESLGGNGLAFQVQNASGQDLLKVDTANSVVYIGSGAAGTTLVLSNDSSQPAEIDGAMYFNTSSQSFQCGQNGTWVACGGGLVASNPNKQAGVAGNSTFVSLGDSYTVPANNCQPGASYIVDAGGQYWSNGQSGTTLSMAILVGSDNIISNTNAVPANASGAFWSLHAVITCISTTAVSASGMFATGPNTNTVTTPLIVYDATWPSASSGLNIEDKFAGTVNGSDSANIIEFMVRRI